MANWRISGLHIRLLRFTSPSGRPLLRQYCRKTSANAALSSGGGVQPRWSNLSIGAPGTRVSASVGGCLLTATTVGIQMVQPNSCTLPTSNRNRSNAATSSCNAASTPGAILNRFTMISSPPFKDATSETVACPPFESSRGSPPEAREGDACSAGMGSSHHYEEVSLNHGVRLRSARCECLHLTEALDSRRRTAVP